MRSGSYRSCEHFTKLRGVISPHSCRSSVHRRSVCTATNKSSASSAPVPSAADNERAVCSRAVRRAAGSNSSVHGGSGDGTSGGFHSAMVGVSHHILSDGRAAGCVPLALSALSRRA